MFIIVTAGVKLVMEAACIMFDEKPVMVNDPTRLGKKVSDAKHCKTMMRR